MNRHFKWQLETYRYFKQRQTPTTDTKGGKSKIAAA
jgi:hypothetical protein